MRILKTAQFLFILFLPLFLFGQSTKELKHITDRIIIYDTEIDLKKGGTPGLIAGLIDGDSTYIVDYGSTNLDSMVRITENTVFEIGSLSKVFTMSLLSVLVHEGLLNLDDPVNKWVPEDYMNRKIGDELKVSDLVNHTAGFPRLPKDFGLKQSNPDDPYSDYTKDDLLTYYATFPFKDRKAGKYVYSHINFAIVEIVCEQASGKSYARLLKEKIIEPLSMENTYLGITEKVIANSAQGYTVSGRKVNQKTYSSFEGSMGIKSTLHDLLILVRTHLGLIHEEYKNIFSDNLKSYVSTGIRESVSVGNAWHILEHKKYYDVIVHPGRISGHQVTIHFVPETRTGVVVMANSDSSLDNLGYMMLALVNNHWKKKKKRKKNKS